MIDVNKYIDDMINLIASEDEILKTLEYTQNYINDKINSITHDVEIKTLKEYLDNNKCETNDDKFTLEPRFEIDRDFQTMFIEILSEVNINEYGEFNATMNSDINEEYKRTFDVHGYENDTFYIRPFNWGDNDCTCGLDENLDEIQLYERKIGFHSKHCSAWETNFYYKPTGLKIAWYKYPLRSAYSNQKLTYDILKCILNDCVTSVLNDISAINDINQ